MRKLFRVDKCSISVMIKEMNLRIFELPPIGTNAYLIIDEDNGKAALFDAPFGAYEEVEKQLKRFNVSLDGVWLTHGHWDHMLDAYAFNEAGIPVYGHKADELFVNNPALMASFSIPGLEFKPAKLDGYLENDSEIEILGQKVKVVHVPGHSPGSVAFIFDSLGWVFSGDIIFAGSVGRTDFPNCSHEELMDSVRKHILPLRNEMILYPGHGPKTTVGSERSLNPFIRELNGS